MGWQGVSASEVRRLVPLRARRVSQSGSTTSLGMGKGVRVQRIHRAGMISFHAFTVRPASLLLALALLPAACGEGAATRRDPALRPMGEGEPRDRDEEIVALLNNEPLSWRTVAEKALELNPKGTVDTYVRWRVVEDRRRALGITQNSQELRRRAETMAKQTRERMGEAAFKAQLEREGLSPEAYVEFVASSRSFETALTVEKIVRYAGLREDTFVVDRMLFVEEEDARRFDEEARSKGFEAAADAVKAAGQKQTVARKPRETFTRNSPPVDPILDEWIVEELAKKKPGEATGVEKSRSNLFYVVRLVETRKGREAAWADVKGEILEGILASPPNRAEIDRWVEAEFARAKVEYRSGSPPRKKP